MIGMTVCSGIGAPELAAPWIDWRYQSEIEPFPCSVLAERFPQAVNLGDMTKWKDWPDATVDVLCGGTPCQSFSVAGLREGLADPRGNLALTYLAIAARYRPRWLVWENVPGVLSAVSHKAPDPCPPEIDLDGSDGPEDGTEVMVTDEYTSVEDHALWCFMAGAAKLGYNGGYISIDAQYVQTSRFRRAIPQRRERIFFVGYLGDWTRAAAVLFDHESLSGHPPPRRETRQGIAPTLGARTGGGGGPENECDCDGRLITSDVASTLNAAFGSKQGLEDQHVNSGCPLFVAHTLRGEGFDASEDGSGRGTPIVPIAFSAKDHGGDAAENVSPTLRAGGHAGSHANAGVMPAIAIQERAVSENPNAGPQGAGYREDGIAYTLEARHHVQAVAFDPNQITSRENRSKPKPGLCHTLPASSDPPMLATRWAVRRLTPTECERLMGFPNGWTAVTHRGKPAADGPRYKALGNSWAVNCGEYVFDRIRMVEGLT